VYFLKNESIRPEFSGRGLAEANEQLDVLKLDEHQRRDYENWEMELHQRASMVKSYYGRGHREGLEKGLEKGREEATAELVRNMLANGISVEQISQVTVLSVDIILSYAQARP
jgi:predicted transposase/invertase (TIGR01784 family)